MRDLDSRDVEAAAYLAREDGFPDDDRPSRAELAADEVEDRQREEEDNMPEPPPAVPQAVVRWLEEVRGWFEGWGAIEEASAIDQTLEAIASRREQPS